MTGLIIPAVVGFGIYALSKFRAGGSNRIPFELVKQEVSKWSYLYDAKIPMGFILAIIEVESSRIPTLKGSANEVGLMQIKAAAHQDSGVPYRYPDDLWDWKRNIETGIKYLVYIYDWLEYHKQWKLIFGEENKTRDTIICYNCGIGNWSGGHCGIDYWNLVKDKRLKIVGLI